MCYSCEGTWRGGGTQVYLWHSFYLQIQYLRRSFYFPLPFFCVGGGYWDRLGKIIGAAWRIDRPNSICRQNTNLRHSTKCRQNTNCKQKTIVDKIPNLDKIPIIDETPKDFDHITILTLSHTYFHAIALKKKCNHLKWIVINSIFV